MTCLLSSLFFIQDEEEDISDGVLTAVFIIVILINSVYLIYWLGNIIPIAFRISMGTFAKCCPKKTEAFQKKMTFHQKKTEKRIEIVQEV
mmetsp:Transcript_38710/g.37054  ORF Transcript_38710/g.37054 Transcript_38710/m.37054 type:complete len:90 (-) Transcript_38710:359-628(-)|eukprot:CAMPEP_0170565170 /NCGR_PEP_ID=MMETSP0211-20121228/77208_1 /TAXON_ID=311385 /ORGANISM="Pseudokeronopsis sp., Strain OXSARD2" /LENGTH=89 /DNA_ID=CAMNT_0010885615 /DNA_START=334 /DNA_END=603 /DNA_ORIENTATION=-